MGSAPPFWTRSHQLGGLLHDGEVGGSSRCRTRRQSPGGAERRPFCPPRWCRWACRSTRPRWRAREGAVCTTTCLAGSASAAHTLSVSSFSVRAPVGQTAMHWPQETQAASPRGVFKGAADVGGKAALVGADDAHGLVGFAGRHTAAAQDALVVVADHMRRRSRRCRSARGSPMKRCSSTP